MKAMEAKKTAGDSTPLTLDEAQLKLLWTSGQRVNQVLAQFSEARNPSEAARLMGWPANRLHYWVRRLHAAGLLVRVNGSGRRYSYRVAALRYRVPLALLPMLTAEMPTATTQAVAHLGRDLAADSYRWLGTLAESAVTDERTGEGYVEVEVGDRLVARSYLPALQTLRVRLTSGKYARLMNRLTTLLAEFADEVEDTGEICTLAVIGYRDP